MPSINSNDWGWKTDGELLLPRWTTIPEASKSCQELTSCKCKTRCGGGGDVDVANEDSNAPNFVPVMVAATEVPQTCNGWFTIIFFATSIVLIMHRN